MVLGSQLPLDFLFALDELNLFVSQYCFKILESKHDGLRLREYPLMQPHHLAVLPCKAIL